MTKKAGIALEDSVETILNRLNVPNKNEIEELSRKIGLLSEKVSTLDGQAEASIRLATCLPPGLPQCLRPRSGRTVLHVVCFGARSIRVLPGVAGWPCAPRLRRAASRSSGARRNPYEQQQP